MEEGRKEGEKEEGRDGGRRGGRSNTVRGGRKIRGCKEHVALFQLIPFWLVFFSLFYSFGSGYYNLTPALEPLPLPQGAVITEPADHICQCQQNV